MKTSLFRRAALAASCALFVTLAAADAAEKRVALSNSVGAMRPKIAATMRPLAAEDLALPINVGIALKMRHFDELNARVARGETISRAELERLYLPLPADYEAVKSWAASEGFTLAADDASRLTVFLRASVAQVQSSLEVDMVKVSVDGVDYPAANSQPTVPDSLAGAVLGVNGLHPYRRLHTHMIRRPTPPASAKAPLPSAVPTNGYTVPEILTAFNGANLGVTGAGQTIAILIDATPLTSDLAGFYSANGLPASTVNNVTTINVNNATITAREGEETLDVEWTSGVAPGAKIRVYATGTLDDSALDNGLARILSDAATDSTIHQLSISLGLGEVYGAASQYLTDAQYFAALASQGISTFVSSGDGGSTPDYSGNSAGPLQVEYYGSDPSVTSVGGTALNTDASFNRTSETVWGPFTTTNGATGGGTSIQFTRPSWQTGTGIPAAAAGTAAMRLAPDVALPADPYTGAYTYYNGAPSPIGGTSWSAPTWAGFCALINQARANAGKTGGIGLLNPHVYPLIGTANFHDITQGNNNVTNSRSAGKYTATAGYDQCTGVGTPDVKVLLNTLVTDAITIPTPTITALTPASGAANTIVSIAGTNFTNAVRVGFNGHQAAFAVISPTQILATVPTDAVTGAVTVITQGKTATSAGAFTFMPTSGAPTISDVAPYETSTTISTTRLVITGTNLANTSAVTINGVSAAIVTKAAAEVDITIPSTSTKGAVSLTTPSGIAVSADTFTTVSTAGAVGSAVPSIMSFAPANGAAGTSVTLTGTNLLGDTAVLFNSVPATAFTMTSPTSVTVTVPAGATTGNITVIGRGGSGVSASAFTVGGTTNAPTITGFMPASGTVGASVTITGSGFTGATAVAFNGTAAAGFTVASDTQIVVAVPAGATTGAISVTAPGGTATSSGTFTVTTTGGGTGTHLVISQVYGGGGGSTGSPTYKSDFIELFNPTAVAVDVSGYSVQYASATGTSYSKTNLTGTILSQHYYLVAEGSGSAGGTLPTADATGTLAMAATAGKVALVSNQTALGTATTSTSAGVVDYVGYGTTANVYEGATGPAPAPSAILADVRAGGGYTDTNDNATDFTALTPNARNSAVTNTSGGGAPDLTVTLTHSGAFTQADAADTYTIVVTNSGTAGASGVVSVSATLRTGLAVAGVAGAGWTRNGATATRSDALAAGGSYPAITLTVSVASNAPASVTPSVTVSGGGETVTANDTATDPTSVTALTPTQSWRYTYFGTTGNTGDAADGANPAADGLPNLLKYALGLDPRVPAASPITVDVSTGYLRLTAPRNPDATDVSIAVQVTGTLETAASWTTTGTTVDPTASNVLQAHDNTPTSNGFPRFLRVVVTRP